MSQKSVVDNFEIAKLFKLVYRGDNDDLMQDTISASISIDSPICRQSCLLKVNILALISNHSFTSVLKICSS